MTCSRYYGSNKFVDDIEDLCHSRVLSLRRNRALRILLQETISNSSSLQTFSSHAPSKPGLSSRHLRLLAITLELQLPLDASRCPLFPYPDSVSENSVAFLGSGPSHAPTHGVRAAVLLHHTAVANPRRLSSAFSA
ncbi:hypothetical protein MLD38_029607 [Melastoma candidum]|uniref:Uncharacterized protein n=1 Tax=Melastoma candidum TaxID=119954 RepID=A0ACB9N4M6_9MYRT|nr:hypothetical protein MLD38_029607 [Melastoma candidum]